MPADTFDNVKGQFPIGFFIWNCAEQEQFKQIEADVFDASGNLLTNKIIHSYGDNKRINEWIKQFDASSELKKQNLGIGFMEAKGSDFQNQNATNISNNCGTSHSLYFYINYHNIIPSAIYLAVRQAIAATWLNDRDQFLYPNNSWESDITFHNDCLAFTLFSGQNRISSGEGINHFIPFTEEQLGIKQDNFTSNCMTDFLAGKNPIIDGANTDDQLFAEELLMWQKPCIRDFSHAQEFISVEAVNVFNAGLELFKFYHKNPKTNEQTSIDYNINASLYDIREYFQGRNDKGKMNNKSSNEKYNLLIGNLRCALKVLAEKCISPKVYEHGFLKA